MKRLIKQAVSPMSRDKAVLYLDGKIYVGESHSDFINSLNLEENIFELPLAYGHIMKNHGRYKEGIYVEDEYLQNVDIDTVVNAIKKYFPGENIYSNCTFDDSTDYFKLLSPSQRG